MYGGLVKNDFRKEVDDMMRVDAEKNCVQFKKNRESQQICTDVYNKLTKWANEITNLYNKSGMNLYGENPAFVLRKQVSAVDDLARMAYESEIMYFESIGIKPSKGWHEFGSSTNNTTEKELINLLSKDKSFISGCNKPKKHVKRVRL